MRARLIKNAVSNLGRGGVGAMVALLLPPILVRHMPTTSYAVWVLILQVSAYMGYLDFGLQAAIGRYVAFANEKKDWNFRDGIFSTAFAGLSIAATAGMLLVLIVALASHRIFPSVPPSLIVSMRLSMLIVGVSAALGLPASAWNGVLIGLQRFDVPAVTTGATRVLSAVGLILAVLGGWPLIAMATIFAGANLLSYGLQFAALRWLAPDIRFQKRLVTMPIIRELSGYSFSLTVWTLSMLLINGLDLLLVGRLEFNAVTPYSVAATLIVFLGGIQSAIFGVIMPHAAQLHAHQDAAALGNLLLKATKLGVLLLLLTGLPLIVFSAPTIRTWIGSPFLPLGGRVLMVLVTANMIRLTGIPFASILIGTGQQRLVVLTPFVEGVTNFFFSIALGLKYGAIGVAWGTLIGAIAAALANIGYNLPRVRGSIQCSPLRYLFEAIVLPASCGIPVFLALPATILFKSVGSGITTPACLVSFCACAFVICRNSFKDFRTLASPLR